VDSLTESNMSIVSNLSSIRGAEADAYDDRLAPKSDGTRTDFVVTENDLL